jgi:hypothetical protein
MRSGLPCWGQAVPLRLWTASGRARSSRLEGRNSFLMPVEALCNDSFSSRFLLPTSADCFSLTFTRIT